MRPSDLPKHDPSASASKIFVAYAQIEIVNITRFLVHEYLIVEALCVWFFVMSLLPGWWWLCCLLRPASACSHRVCRYLGTGMLYFWLRGSFVARVVCTDKSFVLSYTRCQILAQRRGQTVFRGCAGWCFGLRRFTAQQTYIFHYGFQNGFTEVTTQSVNSC